MKRKANLSNLMMLVMLLLGTVSGASARPQLVVGSKRFTESLILGQIISDVAKNAHETEVVYKQGLGNTAIVFAAIYAGTIQIYPEYTGTITQELLHIPITSDLDTANKKLESLGLQAGIPLGFNDSYGLAVSQDLADRLHIQTISDLRKYPRLRLGYSHEFLNRTDGWLGLKSAYKLPFGDPKGFDHDLAYQALKDHQIDIVDVYSTDAKIIKYDLKVLEDDLSFFPQYQAVLLYRANVPQEYGESFKALRKLTNSIDEQRMIQMNADMELKGLSPQQISAGFLQSVLHINAPQPVSPNEARGFWSKLFGEDFWHLTEEHLWLVFVSLALGIVFGVPLGIAAASRRQLAQPILASVGLVQTIPSLALLAFLIPLLHTVGPVPAIIALFLYSLLPIVRNTYTGLTDIAQPLKESAAALGLPRASRLFRIELPLASRSILGGIKTSAVINVGTATIAAFIGAGGYGERIVSGLSTGDNELLLAGAIPAAALAILVQFLFDVAERFFVPRALLVERPAVD